MGILEGKRIVITGVLNDASLAFTIASTAQQEGAEVVLTGFGRGLSITQRSAKKLSPVPQILELDVTSPDNLSNIASRLQETTGWDSIDGLVHSIGFAPAVCLSEDMFEAQWADVAVAVEVSAYSLKSLTEAFLPLLKRGTSPSVVGLDFDASVAWPGYNWMGVAKAALESLARYLARDLGKFNIRVNLVSAGPVRTIAARSVQSFTGFQDLWGQRAPLGWDPLDSTAVAKSVVALLSDWFPKTTGEILHVDGGFHAVGA